MQVALPELYKAPGPDDIITAASGRWSPGVANRFDTFVHALFQRGCALH